MDFYMLQAEQDICYGSARKTASNNRYANLLVVHLVLLEARQSAAWLEVPKWQSSCLVLRVAYLEVLSMTLSKSELDLGGKQNFIIRLPSLCHAHVSLGASKVR